MTIDTATAATVTEIKSYDRFRDMNIGQRAEVYPINPREIVVEEGHNPRDFSLPENREHLDTLKASILAAIEAGVPGGVHQPIWIRWAKVGDQKRAILVDGECRLRAQLELIAEGHDIQAIPATQKTIGVGTPEERALLALTANEGRPLSQLEVGKKYLQLIGLGYTVEKIKEKTGKNVRFINDAIALGKATDEVRQLVATGKVSKQRAVRAIKNEDNDGDANAVADELRKAVAEAAADGNKTARIEKKDKKRSKLERIAELNELYSTKSVPELTTEAFITFMAELNDILEGAEERRHAA